MSAQSFYLYSLAAACLVWSVLGLRFAFSVMAANAVLAFILFRFEAGNRNLLYALMLAYPLYWGMAFAVLRFIERLPLPSLHSTLRLALGCATALGLVLSAHWGSLAREATLLRLTYLVEPGERAAQLDVFLEQSDKKQRCRDSYATLMLLAAKARDAEVLKVFFDAFASCDNGAASTLTEVVKPALDSGDAASLELFLQCGLAPDTEVFGHDYANGTALAYAATAGGHVELVRMIAASAPEKAVGLKYRNNMLEALRWRGNEEMLGVLDQLGIR